MTDLILAQFDKGDYETNIKLKQLLVKQFGLDEFNKMVDNLVNNFDKLHSAIGFSRDISFGPYMKTDFFKHIQLFGFEMFVNEMKISGKRTSVENYIRNLLNEVATLKKEEYKDILDKVDVKRIHKITIDRFKKTFNIFMLDGHITVVPFKTTGVKTTGFDRVCKIIIDHIAYMRRHMRSTQNHIFTGKMSLSIFLKKYFVESNLYLFIYNNAESSTICRKFYGFLNKLNETLNDKITPELLNNNLAPVVKPETIAVENTQIQQRTVRTLRKLSPVAVQTEDKKSIEVVNKVNVPVVLEFMPPVIETIKEVKDQVVEEVKAEQVKPEIVEDRQEKATLETLHLELLEQELKAKAEFLSKFEEYLDLKSKRLKVLNKVMDDGK